MGVVHQIFPIQPKLAESGAPLSVWPGFCVGACFGNVGTGWGHLPPIVVQLARATFVCLHCVCCYEAAFCGSTWQWCGGKWGVGMCAYCSCVATKSALPMIGFQNSGMRLPTTQWPVLAQRQCVRLRECAANEGSKSGWPDGVHAVGGAMALVGLPVVGTGLSSLDLLRSPSI